MGQHQKVQSWKTPLLAFWTRWYIWLWRTTRIFDKIFSYPLEHKSPGQCQALPPIASLLLQTPIAWLVPPEISFVPRKKTITSAQRTETSAPREIFGRGVWSWYVDQQQRWTTQMPRSRTGELAKFILLAGMRAGLKFAYPGSWINVSSVSSIVWAPGKLAFRHYSHIA